MAAVKMFFITWFSSSTPLKLFNVLKPFECFWICMFFRSETDLEDFQGSLLILNALEDFLEDFWRSLLHAPLP
ncbi:hypothetical protein F2Q68_00030858 [Brassica cretica]|uniref:Uncharacterized protein n=1 Tax=Brassica cretica TaxID=69181 RepID=A0A8S9GD76_BRACR|nr:hypothetical protein F2Q68_00030858 [Brassica cretica]